MDRTKFAHACCKLVESMHLFIKLILTCIITITLQGYKGSYNMSNSFRLRKWDPEKHMLFIKFYGL